MRALEGAAALAAGAGSPAAATAAAGGFIGAEAGATWRFLETAGAGADALLGWIASAATGDRVGGCGLGAPAPAGAAAFFIRGAASGAGTGASAALATL